MGQFVCFYPSWPIWAINALTDLDWLPREGHAPESSKGEQFRAEMSEHAMTYESDTYTLILCRDGRFMLRIEALEQRITNLSSTEKFHETVGLWGEYLDYLNALYLLFDSALIEVSNMALFTLSELTRRDVFREVVEDGKTTAEVISTESVVSYYQKSRYIRDYNQDVPVLFDSRIARRFLASEASVRLTFDNFHRVMSRQGAQKVLASYAKALSEYKIGNYETAVILSWFIIEAAVVGMWKGHIRSLNRDMEDGTPRINTKRRDFLTGRDFTLSMICQLLELWEVLPTEFFRDIDRVRQTRNAVVHRSAISISVEQAQLALNTANKIVGLETQIAIRANLSLNVMGF
ncbi:hypothetical protein [Achromobacter denitrificans]|uniref:hypothetical protein n=1 Tax=Achromobacter denitrificans TaxID=32002 RepID=UPI000F4F961F|nr:hypothetical protein [Achromobacter denitrificans]MBV2161973.1 hypothetical protein [Achromobacter denitrificans]MDX3882402.1 hypothetical protein [Achromobacter sp.]QCS65733.1 hypothetical protein EC609_26860 [Achromobacter denitrificans]